MHPGQWIWDNRRVPAIDPFTFASASRSWIDVHWLFQVILAAVFAAGGVPGMILMTAGAYASRLPHRLDGPRSSMPELDRRGLLAAGMVVMSMRSDRRSRDPDAPGGGGLSGGAVADRWQTGTRLGPARHPDAVGQCARTLRAGADHPRRYYLVDRLAVGRQRHETTGLPAPLRRRRWWGHIGGAAVLVGLACPREPLWPARGPPPLEAFSPRSQPGAGIYKSYIGEFVDLRKFVQSPRPDHRGQPLSPRRVLAAMDGAVDLPGTGRLAGRPVVGSAGRGREPGGGRRLARRVRPGREPARGVRAGVPRRAHARVARLAGRLAPIGLVVLGIAGAVLLARSSATAAWLSALGGLATEAWVLCLADYLLGPRARAGGLARGPALGPVRWSWAE